MSYCKFQFGDDRALWERVKQKVLAIVEVLDAQRRAPKLVNLVSHSCVDNDELVESLVGVRIHVGVVYRGPDP